jgi:hypothetical protein
MEKRVRWGREGPEAIRERKAELNGGRRHAQRPGFTTFIREAGGIIGAPLLSGTDEFLSAIGAGEVEIHDGKLGEPLVELLYA